MGVMTTTFSNPPPLPAPEPGTWLKLSSSLLFIATGKIRKFV
jgi:hypothetical protein